MAFAGLVPDYFCLTGTSPDTENSTDYSHSLSPFNMTMWQDRGNNSVNVCDVNSTVCSDYEFQGRASSVVSEVVRSLFPLQWLTLTLFLKLYKKSFFNFISLIVSTSNFDICVSSVEPGV